MRNLTVTLVSGVLLLHGAPALAQDVAAGAAIYGRQCGRCHAPRAPDEYSDGNWKVIMQHMRVVAVMPARDTRDVLAFLQANNGEDGTRTEPPAPGGAAGRALLDEVGCTGCHAIGGVGGTLAPSLDGVGARRSADYLLRKLREPRFDNPQSVMPAMSLGSERQARIVEYLRTLR